MKVSVLLPTYKPNAQHLTETLESLCAQTETDWECIICDEPTDVDTHSMVKKYLADARFQFFRNEKCLGIGANWNRCFGKATGNVIAYLFQDDLWDRDYLATALQIFNKHQNVGFISLNHRYQYDENLWTVEGYEILQKIKADVAPGVHNGNDFLLWWLKRNMHPNIIGEPSFVTLRREVMEEVGPFHERMPQFLDVEYWVRCLPKTDWYNEVANHGAFRVHGQAASFQNNDSGTGLYDRLEVFESLIRLLRGPLRRAAIESRNRSVQDMVKKFLIRVKNKKKVATKGSGQAFTFALRHPFVVGMGIVRVLVTLKRTRASGHAHP